MMEFKLNGAAVQIEDKEGNINLLAFLRSRGLTSVKDGCSQGACGTCTVLVNGKSMRACVLTLSKAAQKSIVTVEGLSEREKEVYAYCFAEAGAVQCGFCIPGMILSAKALLDTNNNPTAQEIKKAIRGNICRCTGYVKIEKAISNCARFFRDGTTVPEPVFSGLPGEEFHRLDATAKALGTGIYVDDMVLPDMVYGKALRTKYPRALIKKIHIDRAAAHPDTVTVLTAKDVPGSIKNGHVVQDWDALIGEGGITRYVGDALALVATKTKEALDEVLELIQVDYEELVPLRSPEEALREDAPNIHEQGNILKRVELKRGNAEEVIKESKHVVTQTYHTPFIEHAFMEPECAVAMPNEEGDGLILYTGGQSVYDEQREVSRLLNLPQDKIRVISKLVGGGFGGKEDMSVQHHAALLAWFTKKTVKVKFSRQESICIHPKRHAMKIEMTTACDEEGRLTAMKARVVSDTGAYASLGGPVLQRACTHAAGPYNYHDIDIEGMAVYTNNPPGGAFRGFGVSQTAFACECNINLLADAVGISPWEIRYKNAVRPGQVLPNGQIADKTTALAECLLAVKDIYESSVYAGIASSFKNSGLGVGAPDTGRCILSVEKGKIHIRTSAACIGQGLGTIAVQIACETLGVSSEIFVMEAPDTARTPDSGTTTASRQTLFTGEAIRRAALLCKKEMGEGKSVYDLEGREFYGEYSGITDHMGSEKENPVSHVAYGYGAQVVILNGKGKLEKVAAAYDVGRAINIKSVEGQIEGGVVMGLGYGLTEDYPLMDCIPQAKYSSLGLFRSTDTPVIETILVESGYRSELACGAKGVGELATIPTAPAVQGAYYKLDGIFRTKLPLEGTGYEKN